MSCRAKLIIAGAIPAYYHPFMVSSMAYAVGVQILPYLETAFYGRKYFHPDKKIRSIIPVKQPY